MPILVKDLREALKIAGELIKAVDKALEKKPPSDVVDPSAVVGSYSGGRVPLDKAGSCK